VRTLRQKPRARVELSGLNCRFSRQRLNYKHIFSGCVKQYQKIFYVADTHLKYLFLLLGYLMFKQPQPNPAELSGAFKRLQRIPG